MVLSIYFSILASVLPAIPAGNFDSSSSQKGLDSGVSSRGAGEDPTTRTGSESVKLRPESTKDTILTISDSEVSDPAGIAGVLPICDFPTDLDQVQVIKQDLGGSTGAQMVQEKKGNRRWILKKGMNEWVENAAGQVINRHDHIEAEFYTNCVYKALNVPVPKVKLYEIDGGVAMLSTFIKGRPLDDFLLDLEVPDENKEFVIKRVQNHFVIDCLLGNYDVIGLDRDNILVTKDLVPVRIDNGSGLKFQAQGARKPDEFWGPEVTELQNMRTGNGHGPIMQAATIFGDITNEQVQTQIKNLLQKKEVILMALPKKYHPIIRARFETLDKIGDNNDTNKKIGRGSICKKFKHTGLAR